MSKKVCIITTNYASSNPRSLREADALHGAGFQVRFVFTQGQLENVRVFDERVLKNKPWSREAVGWSDRRAAERLLFHYSRARAFLADRLPAGWWFNGFPAAAAESRVYAELARLAARERADLYIGHYPAGLAAAASAAQRWQSRYAYDFEDLHAYEQPDTPAGRHKTARIHNIHRRFLGACSYVSVSSELFAPPLAQLYGIARPVVLHNVFSLRERPVEPFAAQDRTDSRLSLYWFSQTVGTDRGLVEAIQAAAAFPQQVQLHIRGALTERVRRSLLGAAGTPQGMPNVFFHDWVAPDELLARAAEHDVGLALEQRDLKSRELAMSNKLFLYFLAGMAVVATDTPGQRAILDQSPHAGFLYSGGQRQALTDIIGRFLRQPGLLQECKKAALQAGLDRWNWEKESAALVEAVSRSVV